MRVTLDTAKFVCIHTVLPLRSVCTTSTCVYLCVCVTCMRMNVCTDVRICVYMSFVCVFLSYLLTPVQLSRGESVKGANNFTQG